MKFLIDDFEEDTDVCVKYKIDKIFELTLLQEEIIYRALKDGLINGVRYGQATIFRFELQKRDSKIKLEDNGIGCENLEKGVGLITIEDRIKGQGGSLKINFKKGKGFILEIEIPLREDKH
ncbi:sensor histidine kinase [Halonatronum saccharophilum]|uniref:sensor histidine kinase n=1 Tax=Halonatronum saccharophilum TaxID=150060 RepID=UPI001B7FD28C|nr:hypothetical protein [Halonatronum saccharophilum]